MRHPCLGVAPRYWFSGRAVQRMCAAVVRGEVDVEVKGRALDGAPAVCFDVLGGPLVSLKLATHGTVGVAT